MQLPRLVVVFSALDVVEVVEVVLVVVVVVVAGFVVIVVVVVVVGNTVQVLQKWTVTSENSEDESRRPLNYENVEESSNLLSYRI